MRPPATTSRQDQLLILPPLKTRRGAGGGFILTRKYIEGAAQFAQSWPGQIASLVALGQHPGTDMDHEEFFPDDPLIPIELRPETDRAMADRLRGAAVVLAFLSPSEAPLARLCQEIGVPLVFFTEYSPATERQIIDAETSNPFLRLRRKLWLTKATRIRRSMLAQAAGLQCSGHPVYGAYHHLNANSLLFFDNRAKDADIISETEIDKKVKALATGQPLRLVFGGRLIAMKGVEELPKLAGQLVKDGTPFTLDIYGSGPLEEKLRQTINSTRLDDRVKLRGVRDFRTGWLPVLKHQTDVFLCCHLQGDPSSTYPEVMSCGSAIAGYDNEAFRGIVGASGSGWLVPMGDYKALARTVTRLHHDRTEMAGAIAHARSFALEHSFEKTFARRVAHLVAASRLPDVEKARY